MKFVSWNVNGLRACIQKGFLQQFDQLDADFFCLQETKLSEGQLELELPGYFQYWNYAEKKGYSGTAIFTKHEPLSVSYGIGVPELDNEGRVITLEYEEFYLLTCYTPNAQRLLARIDHRMKWDDAFREYIAKLDSIKPVILCGDLNVAHKEIDLKNPNSNRGNAGFSDQERESFGKTLELGFTDTFRHLYPDATGKYSWWSYMYNARQNNAGWRIDYFLVSDRLKDEINQADIHSQIMGSDHCPVSLDLNTSVNGSIWSPTSMGHAKQTFPPEKPKKEPKASATTAKAILALLALFLFTAVSIFFVLDRLDQPSKVNKNLNYRDYVVFDVTVYYTPLRQSTGTILDSVITGSTNAIVSGSSQAVYNAVVPISDDEHTYYISGESAAYLTDANISVRIDLSEEAAELDTQWELSIESHSETNENISIEPYYTDTLLENQGGWVVLGRTSNKAVFNLTVTSPDVVTPYTEAVTLIPYLIYAEADSLTTEELARYVASHDYIAERLKAVSDDGQIYLFNYISVTNIPALWLLYQDPEGIDALMNLTGITESERANIYTILSSWEFRSKMTDGQEAAFLTRLYESALMPLTFSDIDYDYSSYTTEELLDEILINDSLLGTTIVQCTSADSIRLVYEVFSQLDSLQELQSRSDAADVIHAKLTEEANPVAMRLLSVPVYFQQLEQSQKQEYFQAVFNYSVDVFRTIVGSSYDTETINTISTEQMVSCLTSDDTLLELLDYHQFLTDLQEANDFYSLLLEQYPLLRALQNRDDAVKKLMYSDNAGNGRVANLLLANLNFQQKMTAEEEAAYLTCQYDNCLSTFTYVPTYWDVDCMTTEELVENISTGDIRLLLSCRRKETQEYVYAFLTGYSQLLRALEGREDAVEALMNTNPKAGSISSLILSLQVYQEKMTPEQKAAFDAGDYPSHISIEDDDITYG